MGELGVEGAGELSGDEGGEWRGESESERPPATYEGMKRMRRSSSESAWRRCLMPLFDAMKGRYRGKNPTDATVSLRGLCQQLLRL